MTLFRQNFLSRVTQFHRTQLAVKLGVAMLVLSATLIFATLVFAQTITGTVTNATSGKSAAGEDVALVDPMQGMAEVAKAKTDAQGRFTLSANGQTQGPRVVRVTRQSVNYFKMVPPGTANINIQIYDAVKSLSGIYGTANVMRLQADKATLRVVELYAVRNQSTPPQTLIGDQTFVVTVPDGAQLDGADVQGPNGQPISVTPTPLKAKGQYVFSYPLKPGETRFQIAYSIAYNGEAAITPRLPRDFEHFVVVLPQGMKWKAANAAAFRPLQDQPGTVVQVSLSARKSDDLSFKISGYGTIADEPDTQDAQAQSDGQVDRNDNRPGGGLGAPIDAPDALEKYRWVILAGLAAALLAGALYTTRRGQLAPVELNPARAEKAATNQVLGPSQMDTQPSSLLLALRDELFQLELDRQQGKVSDEEYQQLKSALDQTLSRAISRSASV